MPKQERVGIVVVVAAVVGLLLLLWVNPEFADGFFDMVTGARTPGR